MEQFKNKKESVTTSTENQTRDMPMEKPQIHTTKSGTQYVNVSDVVRSKSGWAEIQRLKDANLVPTQPVNGSKSSQTNEK